MLCDFERRIGHPGSSWHESEEPDEVLQSSARSLENILVPSVEIQPLDALPTDELACREAEAGRGDAEEGTKEAFVNAARRCYKFVENEAGTGHSLVGA